MPAQTVDWVNRDTCDAHIGGHPGKWDRGSVDTLVAIIEAGGQITRDDLERCLWPWEQYPVSGEDRLNKKISRLRRDLGDDADRPRYLQTIPKPRGGDRPTTYVLLTTIELRRAGPIERALRMPTSLPGRILSELGRDAREGERLAARTRLIVMVILVITQGLLIVLAPTPGDATANKVLLVIALVGFAYALAVDRWLVGHYDPRLAWITTLTDAVVLTGSNVLASVYVLRQPDAITKWASLLALYFVIIIVAGLRLSPALAWLAGGICTALFFMSLVVAVRLAPVTSSYDALSSGSVNLALGLVFDGFLLLATWCVVQVVRLARARQSQAA